MNSDEYDDREPMSLVLPFVCVASVGGPYADEAFAAGWQAGTIAAKLADRRIAVMTEMVRTPLVEQLDLVAMDAGYSTDTLDVLDDGWTHLGFTRVDT